MMMHGMYFSTTPPSEAPFYVLFQGAYVANNEEYALAWILCFLFGIFATVLHECCKALELTVFNSKKKKKVYWNILAGVSVATRMASHYLAMLVAMTYNVGLFFAIILGHGAGGVAAAFLTQAYPAYFPQGRKGCGEPGDPCCPTRDDTAMGDCCGGAGAVGVIKLDRPSSDKVGMEMTTKTVV